MDCEELLTMKLTVCMCGKNCIAEHKNSSNTLFMHRLKSSTKFTTWSMNYVVFSLSSFIMISSVWKFTPNMFLARETHMHSFFNFHIPKYFPVSPIFPKSLLNLIGACLSACRDSQHMLVCFVCWIVFEFFLYFIFSTEVMTQALIFLQGICAYNICLFF